MNLIYEKTSYKIIGAIYETYNCLGYGHREKTYQQALAKQFRDDRIKFEKEVYFPISFKGKIVSRYFYDFLVENKIIVEVKVAKDFYQSDVNQILAYLKTNNYRLGVLAIFTEKGVKIKRIVN